MSKLEGEFYFQLRHLTGRVKQEVIVGEVEEEIYAGRIYRVHFNARRGIVPNYGKVYMKDSKQVYEAPAKLEARGELHVLILTDAMKASSSCPIINISKLLTVTVTPLSALPQFDLEIKLDKYDLSLYTASLTSDSRQISVGDYFELNGAQLEVVDVHERNVRLKEVG